MVQKNRNRKGNKIHLKHYKFFNLRYFFFNRSSTTTHRDHIHRIFFDLWSLAFIGFIMIVLPTKSKRQSFGELTSIHQLIWFELNVVNHVLARKKQGRNAFEKKNEFMLARYLHNSHNKITTFVQRPFGGIRKFQ